MDNLADLLARRKRDEPADISMIKAYIQEHFHEHVNVTIRERDILITVRSSAVAGAVRICSQDITSRLEAKDKRLVFRVGAIAG